MSDSPCSSFAPPPSSSVVSARGGSASLGVGFDVAWRIALLLELPDLLSLSEACRQWRHYLLDEGLWRRALRDCAAHAPETLRAHQTQSGFRTAARRISQRRQALQTAQPQCTEPIQDVASAVVTNGYLCLVSSKTLVASIMNLVDEREPVLMVDLGKHAGWEAADLAGSSNRAGVDMDDSGSIGNNPIIRLLSYNRGILAYQLTTYQAEVMSRQVVFVKVRPPPDARSTGQRVECDSTELRRVPIKQVLVEVHSATDFLIIVAESAARSHRRLRLVGGKLPAEGTESLTVADSLLSEGAVIKRQISSRFGGRHLGKTLAAHLDRAGVLHLVSLDRTNSHQDEGAALPPDQSLDYYACMRIPLADIDGRQTSFAVRRDPYSEGPAHDSWGQLSLQIDERSGRLCTVEVRRVWVGGGTQQKRFCAVTKWPWPVDSPLPDSASEQEQEEAKEEPLLEPDFSSSQSCMSDQTEEAGRPRFWRQTDGGSSTPTLWRVRASFYRLSIRTFVDVYATEDSSNSNGTGGSDSQLDLEVRTAFALPEGAGDVSSEESVGSAEVWVARSVASVAANAQSLILGDERCLVILSGSHSPQQLCAGMEGLIAWYDPALASSARHRVWSDSSAASNM